MKNLKRMLPTIVPLLMCMVHFSSQAYYHSSSKTFNIRAQDQAFLRYNRVVNPFDTSIVGVEAGEFEIGGAATWGRVNWKWIQADKRFQGQSTLGADYSLAAVLESEPFLYQGQDSVRFYRMAFVNNRGCDPGTPPSGGGHGNGSGVDGSWTDNDWWSTVPNDIRDTSIFVIEVVRATDGVVVGTIDSVRIGANPTSSVVPHSGTAPSDLYHQRTLNGLSVNTSYCFRIKPVRYGTSAHGMSALQFGMWINLGYIRERDSVNVDRFDPATNSALLIEYADSALAFIDSVYWSTGEIPSTEDIPLFGAQYDTLIHRYYDSVEISPGMWALEVKPRPSSKPAPTGRARALTDTQTKRMATWDAVVYPNPSHGEPTVRFSDATFNTDVRIKVVDNTGRTVYETSQYLPRREVVDHPLRSDLPAGTYAVVCYDFSGRPNVLLRMVVAGNN